MKPLYIFDLDGTLALIEHRRHLVEGERKDWPAFFAACVDDAPNPPVIRTLQALRTAGAEIWIWSGRSDEVKAQTVDAGVTCFQVAPGEF
jgi:phosphoserine phosphatase